MQRVIRTIVFSAIVVGLIEPCSNLFLRKDPQTISLRHFWQPTEEDYDVLALGASYVYCSFNPIELYRNFGLRSYALSTSMQDVSASYFLMEEALKRYHPKVVIVGASFFIRYPAGNVFLEANAHKAMDSMPSILTKAKMVTRVNLEDGVENYLFPFLKYHSRWKELSKIDFRIDQIEQKLFRGYSLLVDSKENVVLTPIPHKNVNMPHEYKGNLQWLDKMYHLAKAHNCDLVLYQAPHRGADCNGRLSALHNYAQKLGIKFIDLASDLSLTGINEKTDFFDKGHLNVYGSDKVMRYMGDWLTGSYVFNISMTEEERKVWQEDVLRYDLAREKAVTGGRPKE